MSLSSEITRDLESVFQKAQIEVTNATDSKSLEEVRVKYLGKKSEIASILSRLRELSDAERREVGNIANRIRDQLENLLQGRRTEVERAELSKSLESDRIDSSLPGRYYPVGKRHPIHLMMTEASQILETMGLVRAYGPEVEYEEFCFDRLNFKPNHPARDMQATFYVEGGSPRGPVVLRTHTSPVQVRTLLEIASQSEKLPLRVQAPGRVYRVDDDATHSPMFHQIEGLVVDTKAGLPDLRSTLETFFRKVFGGETKIRFRPSFFPFTEPSVEVDVSCVFCQGKGCKICKTSGWLEVAGAGLIHPEVFRACDWNPDEVQGWAFGMGVDRLAMLKYQIPDLRLFFENRLSFLRGSAE